MSDSSDEETVIRIRPGATAHKRKRQRLSSENSDQTPEDTKTPEVIQLEHDNEDDSNHDNTNGNIEIKQPRQSASGDILDEESIDEITIVSPNKNGAKRSVMLLEEEDDDDDEEAAAAAADDDDESDVDEADREDDAIIESLYDDEDNFVSDRSAKAQKRVNSLREHVVDFFQNASMIDLVSIPGVSKKKVEQIVTLRPILSWEDLNKKISNHKSAGINEDVVINAVKTIKSRNVVEKLMTDCQKLAQDIGQLVDKLPEAPQPKCIPSPLKLAPYQLVGLNWLALMHSKGINGILADEMGLGKTIQVIAFLAYLRESLGLRRHHLIIVPASTIDNWEREFDTWCPEIRLLQYYGTQQYRAQVRFHVAKNPNDVDVVLTTYNVAQNADDKRLFKHIGFEYIVFDEAHMLKNMKSSRYQSLIKIKSRKRILLTGTPLQNNLVELMSLLVFTMPKMFGNKMDHVEALFSTASREEGGKTQFEKERIEQAKRIMRPFVLRRLKKDVLRDLPKKTEETIFVPLSETQSKLTKQLVDSFKREIKDHADDILNDDSSFATDSSSDIKKGAGMLMAMRKAANHPLLMLNHYTKDKLKKMAKLMLKDPSHRDANEHLIYEDMSIMHDYELHRLCKTYKPIASFKLSDDIIVDSGKFQYLDKLLPKLAESDQKCLLFSQFTMMLDIMEEYLTIRGHNYLRLDGTTKVSDRIDLIDHFNANQDVLVFLLSTKAGGLGINLTAANVVVIHDIDFNPYNDKQAEDRSHRMGQEKDVHVYKLISKGTIEEGMLDIATEKLRLGRDMSDEQESDQNGMPPTKDLRSLLRVTLKL